MSNDTYVLIDRAASVYQENGLEAALEVLKPLMDRIEQEVWRECSNPYELDMSAWNDESLHGKILNRWRDAIIEWRAEGFTGTPPGRRALEDTLNSLYCEGDPFDIRSMDMDIVIDNDAHEDDDAPENAGHLSTILSYLADASDELHDALVGRINEALETRWFTEATEGGVPSHAHAEIWWVPGWDGHSLDDTDHVHLRGKRYNSTYIEDLDASDGLRNFLQWLNISSEELVAEAIRIRPGEGEKLRDTLAEKNFSVDRDQSRPNVVSPEDALIIIENAGYPYCLPTVHAYVELRSLLELDPRLPIALPLRCGKMSIGLHDTINGAGYMDTFAGTAVIPPMSLGIGWANRGRYGINETYGLALHSFYCTPENIGALPTDTQVDTGDDVADEVPEDVPAQPGQSG